MINEIIRQAFRFCILVLLQVLIIQNIELGRFINPFLYILFILMLPFNIPQSLSLILSFLLGLGVDLFYNTGGMHAAACVLMGFCRPGVLKLIAPRDGYESGKHPSIEHLGTTWFLTYAGLLTLIHHLFLFYLEIFRFSEFFSTLLRVLLSSIFSMLFIVIVQFFYFKRSVSDFKNY